MISENLKITFDNREIFDEYQRLLFEVLKANDSLNNAIGYKNPKNQLIEKVKDEAWKEYHMLWDKLSVWNMDWSNTEKEGVVSVGDCYKHIHYNNNDWSAEKKRVTFIRVTSIDDESESNSLNGRQIHFETITISSRDITVRGKNIDKGLYPHDDTIRLEPFVAYVLSGKYKKVDESEFIKVLDSYNKQYEMYKYYIEDGTEE